MLNYILFFNLCFNSWLQNFTILEWHPWKLDAWSDLTPSKRALSELALADSHAIFYQAAVAPCNLLHYTWSCEVDSLQMAAHVPVSPTERLRKNKRLPWKYMASSPEPQGPSSGKCLPCQSWPLLLKRHSLPDQSRWFCTMHDQRAS